METARIPHVEGNVLKLAIPLTLQTITRNNGETSTRIDDYIPSSNYPVWVEFTKGIVKHRFRATMQDNVAFVEDKGKMRYGKYDIAVLCNDDNGDPRKFKQRTVLEVFEYTADAGLPTGIEFNSETHWLDAAVFIAYNGGISEEVDPTVPKWVKEITEEDIEKWYNKQDKVLVVSFTKDGRTPPRYSADKTFAEISAAISAGTTVVAKDEEGCFCQLVEYSDSIISFIGIPDYSERVVSIFDINDRDRSTVEHIFFGLEIDDKLLRCEEFNQNRDMYSYVFPDDVPTPLMAWNFEEGAYFLYDLTNDGWIRIGEASNGIADITTQSSEDIGGMNTITITLTNGQTRTFTVMNGSGSVDDILNINSPHPIANKTVTAKFDELTQGMSQLVGYSDYNRDSETIRLYDKQRQTVLATVSGFPFVRNVYISNNTLVVTFSEGSGRSAIGIPLSGIFNPNNYLTKVQVNAIIDGIYDDLGEMIGDKANLTNGKVPYGESSAVVLDEINKQVPTNIPATLIGKVHYCVDGKIRRYINSGSNYAIAIVSTPDPYLIYFNRADGKFYTWSSADGMMEIETGSGGGYQVSYSNGVLSFTGDTQPTYNNGVLTL